MTNASDAGSGGVSAVRSDYLKGRVAAVSYTHLTLPTIYSV